MSMRDATGKSPYTMISPYSPGGNRCIFNFKFLSHQKRSENISQMSSLVLLRVILPPTHKDQYIHHSIHRIIYMRIMNLHQGPHLEDHLINTLLPIHLLTPRNPWCTPLNPHTIIIRIHLHRPIEVAVTGDLTKGHHRQWSTRCIVRGTTIIIWIAHNTLIVHIIHLDLVAITLGQGFLVLLTVQQM